MAAGGSGDGQSQSSRSCCKWSWQSPSCYTVFQYDAEESQRAGLACESMPAVEAGHVRLIRCSSMDASRCTGVLVRVCPRVPVFVLLCACAFVPLCVCASVSLCVCVSVCLFVSVSASVSVFVCLYVCLSVSPNFVPDRRFTGVGHRSLTRGFPDRSDSTGPASRSSTKPARRLVKRQGTRSLH